VLERFDPAHLPALLAHVALGVETADRARELLSTDKKLAAAVKTIGLSVGDDEETASALRKSTLALAKKTGVSPTDLALALVKLALGFDEQRLKAATTVALEVFAADASAVFELLASRSRLSLSPALPLPTGISKMTGLRTIDLRPSPLAARKPLVPGAGWAELAQHPAPLEIVFALGALSILEPCAARVESLDVTQLELKTLDDLKPFTTLKTLRAHGSFVKFDPLGAAPLTSIVVTKAKKPLDLSALKGKTLEQLWVNGSCKTLEPIAAAPLRQLSVTATDLTPIQGKPTLTHLHWKEPVGDVVAVLKTFASLEDLQLEGATDPAVREAVQALASARLRVSVR